MLARNGGVRVGRIPVETRVLTELLRVLEMQGDSVGLAALMGYLAEGVNATVQPPVRPWDIATVASETPPHASGRMWPCPRTPGPSPSPLP